MAKKRGRPAKTTPSTTKHDSAQKQSISDLVLLDLETVDDLDIDSLTPKQAEKVLTALDEIRLRISEKTGSGSGSNKEDEGNKEKQTLYKNQPLLKNLISLTLRMKTPGLKSQHSWSWSLTGLALPVGAPILAPGCAGLLLGLETNGVGPWYVHQ
ncbi:hypothetical protein RIF29_25385 [Crotalaria pallida]|uniref:Uncharacterized protein n=1 Tax=Crotalaria pallida TaxID=3830 RepID=A0AAN9ELH5_CROPI